MEQMKSTVYFYVFQYELIYKTFGRHHFRKITSNLDVSLVYLCIHECRKIVEYMK